MVSAIITTYGANKKLIRAIESVLHQSYEDIEVIVVDDNNPDSYARQQTEKMMKRYESDHRIRYIKHTANKNGAAARNTGIEVANGEYIAFLDDDDFFLKKKIEKSVTYLVENQNLVGVCQIVARVSNNRLVDIMHVEEGHILTVEDLLISREGIGSGSNIFVRKDIVNEVGGFDIQFKRKQDIEFMLRVIERGSVAFQQDIEIVKDVSGIRRLNYENNRLALQQFIDKFDYEISNLSAEKRKEFFIKQYTFLYNIAKLTGDKTKIQMAVRELEEYDNIATKKLKNATQIALKYKLLSLSRFPIASRIIAILKNKKYNRMEKIILTQIGDTKYQEIEEILGMRI